MLSIWQRISNDFQTLWLAVNLSKKNPFFVFQELFSFLASLVLLLFLVSLGKKLLKFFHLRINLKEELLFALGLGIVFWGTLILLLGIFNLFNFWLIWGMAFFLFLICLPEVIAVVKGIGGLRETKKRVFFYFFLLLVILNVIGALTPEKGVDAIDYHLYFSKVYLQNQTMMLPARGSRLFSLFPHLVSLIYTLPISLDLTNVAQLTHLWLGVLTAIVVGILTQSFIASLIFYSLLTVGSISRSAYSDFFVCYFLSLGILGIVGENKGDKRRTILLSGLMFGGALATKNQSLALLPLLIILWLLFRQKEIINLFKLLVISFLVPLPWYLRSTVITGNPLYPLFELKDIRVPQLDLNYYFKFEFLKYLKVIFSFQPVFLLVFLFVIFSKSSLKNKKLRAYFLAGVLIFLFWVILPISFHDNRYFLPFFILILLAWTPLLTLMARQKWFKLGMLVILGVLVLIRFYTNVQYLPYVFGLEEKSVFLSNALRERTEDFYDIDGIFSGAIRDNLGVGEVKILTDNVLGLYYLEYPFTEFEYSSFYGKKMTEEEFESVWREEKYTYLLLKNESLADFFAKIGIKSGAGLFKLIVAHTPSKTYLFKPSFK